MTEWLAALEYSGFRVCHSELLEKPIAFQPWAKQLNCSADDIKEMVRMIDEGSTTLRAHLRPQDLDGERWITLMEAVIVADIR